MNCDISKGQPVKKITDFTDYKEACDFLQDKYDQMGYTRKDYLHRLRLGKQGLQYHHIKESEVPDLSLKENVEKYPEYQQPECMCYANLIEHAWLHVLISENNFEQNDNAQEALTGVGGVQWLMLALNSIMCNADLSWFGEYLEHDECVSQCNYNINNIITNNREEWRKIVVRFCTSPYIRQRLNKSPKELAEVICRTCKDDAKLPIFAEIVKYASVAELFQWNVNAFIDLLGYLKKDQSALVYICTGGGKTTTALEYLRVNNIQKDEAIALGPSCTVLDSWDEEKKKKNAKEQAQQESEELDIEEENWEETGKKEWESNGVKAETYQSFMNSYKVKAEQDWSRIKVIICDEAHHIKAKRWGEGIRWVMKHYPEIKVIGLTATPTAEQLNGTDKEFCGRICYGLDLAEGIKNGLLYPISYVSSIFRMIDVKADFEKYGVPGRLLWEKLNLELNKNPIDKILREHMPSGQRKIIVFCDVDRSRGESETSMVEYAKQVMKAYDKNLHCEVITTAEAKRHRHEKDWLKKTKDWFNNTKDEDVCLITIGMVNEGAHYDGVNTLIMFRKTNSPTLYLQQLGRAIVTTYGHDDPKGIVFDFTNNAEFLIHQARTFRALKKPEETELTDSARQKLQKAIAKFKAAIKEKSSRTVIYQDYTEDCAETLEALREASEVTTQTQKVYGAYLGAASVTEDAFDFSLWGNLKKGKGGALDRHPKASHPSSSGTHRNNNNHPEVSNAQRLYTAFAMAVRRLYNYGYLTFTEDTQVRPVLQEEGYPEIKALGFTSIEVFKQIMETLGKTTFITAVDIAE